MQILVTKKRRLFLHEHNPFAVLLAAITIYAMIIPMMISDVATSIYQAIYFSVFDIPKIDRREYVVMDRWDLKKLNLIQKLNCVYCEYGNGVTAWAKAVASQTEIHSCAIKHRHLVRGQQEGEDYYKYSDFKA